MNLTNNQARLVLLVVIVVDDVESSSIVFSGGRNMSLYAILCHVQLKC
jgi:hypothetical protein